jgi:16S rRNA (cytosine967-C5)-methyltransferase
VHTIPGFDQGIVSVQDEAAQLSADLLAPQPGETVLDACCAPGGKTGHLLEIQPKLSRLVALDLEQRRLERVKDNLQRLGLTAEIVCHDAQQIQDWWDGELFDRILLDAPCSATGVIRRHPDIKLLRKATDIAKLASLQLSLLKALWTTLRPGGRLVYATCSILPTENTQVIEAFVEQQPDAIHRPIDAPWGLAQKYGRQLLPQQQGHDGFYYACLEKTR